MARYHEIPPPFTSTKITPHNAGRATSGHAGNLRGAARAGRPRYGVDINPLGESYIVGFEATAAIKARAFGINLLSYADPSRASRSPAPSESRADPMTMARSVEHDTPAAFPLHFDPGARHLRSHAIGRCLMRSGCSRATCSTKSIRIIIQLAAFLCPAWRLTRQLAILPVHRANRHDRRTPVILRLSFRASTHRCMALVGM